MNDHNLDDLIIDNINPKNTKAKSLLTIVALAIVVLIIAIILTKIILKDPSESQAIDEKNNTEIISPELTLQNTINKEIKEEEHLALDTSDTKGPTKNEATIAPNTKTISKKEVLEPTESEPVKAKTIEITQDIFDDERESNTTVKEKKIKERKKHDLEKKVGEKKITAKETPPEKKKNKVKTTENTKSKQVQENASYYIQVGSFKQAPTQKFLSIIKKSGFNYKVTSHSNSGIKKLLIGPYSNRNSADRALKSVRDRINKSAFVIKK